jgi:hypothetical protein
MERNQPQPVKKPFWLLCPACGGEKDSPQDVYLGDKMGNEYIDDCNHRFHSLKPYYEPDL